jgi:hypothetical protein
MPTSPSRLPAREIHMRQANPIWQRHDWHRFIRHDAQRFLNPAGVSQERRAAEAEKAAQRRAQEVAAAEQEAFEREALELP